MKAALLTRYDRLGASSRVRMLLQLPYLQAAGIESVVYPLFENAYLERLYAGKPTTKATAHAVLRRLADLRRLRGVDLLWIEKELIPWLPFALERGLLPRYIPYALDFDDAVFHRYDQHRSGLVRRLLGRKFDQLIAGATLVTVGNAYLAQRATEAGATWVEVVPTVVDVSAYLPAQQMLDRPLRIGWIGSPSTWSEYMEPILPALLETAAYCDARLMVVGAAAASHPLLVQHNWSEDTEVELIREMDIGIMPLIDTAWSRGKCGYKLIQYMACGIPVIASPVGVNAEIVEHGVNGFLASDDTEWSEALQTLLQNSELRAQMGEAGRRKVELEYSLQVWGQRVAQMLRDVANKGKCR